MSNPIGLLDQPLDLDRADHRPLFSQIAAALAERLRSGAVPPGMRLPAVRVLARDLGVNRATVQRAYQELEELGLTRSRVGSGTVVIAEAPPAVSPDGHFEFSRGIRQLRRAAGVPPRTDSATRSDAIDFAMMLPDVSLFPTASLEEAVAAALGHRAEVLQYGAPAGLERLRRVLATRLSRQGLNVGADDILIVNGVQQALDLIAKVLLDPGDVVALEAPTYASVLPLLELYGARTQAIALDDDGIQLGPLAQAIRQQRPKLLYTMPSFHNPTGVTMSLERRRGLIELCSQANILLVEDGCEQDLHFDPTPLAPLAALAGADAVAHLGTFSKGLFPGLRLGYIVARGELREMLLLAKRFSDYHADLLSQAVMTEILERGDYDVHIAGLRDTYRERMNFTVAALTAHLPDGIRFRTPRGGYKIWLELPPGVGAARVAEQARQRGVLVLASDPFYANDHEGDSALRLSISRTDPARIEAGVRILSGVLEDAIAARTRRPTSAAAYDAPPLV